jgi:oligopeptide transport system substrate-binding protein
MIDFFEEGFLMALRRAILVLLALAATAAAGAKTLHLHNGGDVASLDPHKVSGDWENRVVGDLFEGLMTEDALARPIPGMAARYEESADGRIYTFYLRDALWSNGDAVTAHDFVFAFRRLMDPANAAKYAWLQYPINNAEAINKGDIADITKLGVEAVDDKTLRITLESPTPYFIGALTHYTAYPLPRRVVEAHGDKWARLENIVTNGPYRPTEWTPGSHVKSTINQRYYAAADLDIREVIYYTLEDESAALRRFEAGEFDIVTEFPIDQIARLREERIDEVFVAPMAGIYYYVFNNNMPMFRDKQVREALSLAINREVIAERIVGGGEVPAFSWVPPGVDNYGEPAFAKWRDTPYQERLTKAKELMASAGYGEGSPLTITLRYNTNENHKRVAVAIAAMWKPLGVVTELFNTEVKVHYEDLNNNDFVVARAGWLADYNDPINFLELLVSDNIYNYGRWQNREYDELMEQAARETDLEKRAALFYRAEQIAVGEFAVAPIYYYVTRNLVADTISGFENNVFDIHRTRWLKKAP